MRALANVVITKREFPSFLKISGVILLFIGLGFSISLTSIGMGLYATGLLLDLIFLRRSASFPPIPNLGFLVILIAFLCLNFVIHHEYPMTSLRGFWKYLGGFLTMWSIIDVARDQKRWDLLLKSLLLVYGIAALAALWQKWAGYDFIYFRPAYIDGMQVRLLGTFKHYNDFGTFLVGGILISLGFSVVSMFQKRKLSACLGVGLCLTLLYLLIHSLSRSAFIAAFFGLFVFFLHFKAKKITLFVLVTATIGFVLFYPPLRERFEYTFNRTQGSTAERLLLANISLKMIQKNPWTGLGMNTYSEYYPQFKPADYPGLMYAHNSYLQLATEIGLVGLFLYLLYIASCLKHVWLMIRETVWQNEFNIFALSFICVVLGLLVNGLFESLLQSTQLRALFWTSMGFMIASATLRRLSR